MILRPDVIRALSQSALRSRRFEHGHRAVTGGDLLGMVRRIAAGHVVGARVTRQSVTSGSGWT
jgi:hypothetical protein